VGALSPARLIMFTNQQLNRGLFLSDRAPPFYAKAQVFHKRHKIPSASVVEEALIAISTAEFSPFGEPLEVDTVGGTIELPHRASYMSVIQ